MNALDDMLAELEAGGGASAGTIRDLFVWSTLS
jgi:hypothetical protein